MKKSSGKDLSGAGSSGAPGPIIPSKHGVPTAPPPDDALFGRVASILEQARANVVRAVNHNMVVAYWLIGREIVMELQRGRERAGYGRYIIASLAERLTATYGKGWSETNLGYFRTFFQMYSDRGVEIPHTPCGEFVTVAITPSSHGDKVLDGGGNSAGFELSWSHYRALITVHEREPRDFYEREALAANWTVRELERQISTRYYERRVSTQRRLANAAPAEDRLSSPAPTPVPNSVSSPVLPSPLDTLKDPYVLEFLDIPDPAALHESGLEGAIIAHLRDFMLELGKGFAFVARQKRLSFDGDDMYVDLVFYNWKLRCFLLVDLKMGRLTAGDVGQMDSYVRMFDDLMAGADDNPTIGLILCTEHNGAVARYSVLNDRAQIFASRYVTCMPSESELAAEIQRTRALIEGRAVSGK